jgi:archaellum biogenesis ATPase FlaH
MENALLAVIKSLLHDTRTANVSLTLDEHIAMLPASYQAQIHKRLMQLPRDASMYEIAAGNNGNGHLPGLLTSDQLLAAEFPDPKWIVPGMISTGLTILGGAPKMGKSWMALQLMLAVGSGGKFLGHSVQKRNCLYLALEDPPKRLQDRMRVLGWTTGVSADFYTIYALREVIKSFDADGANRLQDIILSKGYELIIIDTLSRIFTGDKNEEKEIMRFVGPLHECASQNDIALKIVHHHGKVTNKDVVRDLMGSTAIGGAADNLLGIYRERGTPGAELCQAGRDIEEKTIRIRFDTQTHCWQLDDNSLVGLTADQADLVMALETLQPANLKQIVEALGLKYPEEKGKIFNRLGGLESKRRIIRDEDGKYRLGDG